MRRVLRKERDTLWTPPDWHYLEKAQTLGLKVVRLRPGGRHQLADGTRIEVRGDQVGLGDGYLIHGTHVYNKDSLGQAASHGCVRMRDEDLEFLFDRVAVGTPVHIF